MLLPFGDIRNRPYMPGSTPLVNIMGLLEFTRSQDHVRDTSPLCCGRKELGGVHVVQPFSSLTFCRLTLISVVEAPSKSVIVV